MDDNEGTTKAFDLLRQQKPLMPEEDKFSFYDERGQKLYNQFACINNLIVRLHDEVRNNVFTDIDYYQVVGVLPVWIRDAGHSQESAMTREFFEKLVGANNNYFVNKFLYYHDCEMLVNALQNRFCTVETLLNQVFTLLDPVLKYNYQEYDNVIFTIEDTSERVNAYINTIIITLASICDIMTKIAIELEGMSTLDFTKYPKMLSANSTYGDCRRLPDALKQKGTYFAADRSAAIVKVETLRNEIVHNGSLDFNARMYYGIKGDEIENWILVPSFKEDGNFSTYNGRKKFYDDPKRIWNTELPAMTMDFLVESEDTLQLLLKKYSKDYYENDGDLKKYHNEILSLTSSFMAIVEKEAKKQES